MVNKEYASLEKIFSALIVPMSEDGDIRYELLRELVEMQLADGVEGFYCLGSSGESLLLSLEERKKVLEKVVEAVAGRAPVIAHVGTIRTADAVELARHAQRSGVQAISMIPPYYYHFSMEEIIAYYEEIMQSVCGLHTIIYNIPQFTGVEFHKKNAARLLENPAVIGIKHTSQNLYSLERMKQSYPEKLFFNGFDEQFLGAFAMGATGAIGTTVNLFAPLFLNIREHFQKGEMDKARALQKSVNEKIETMLEVGIFNAVKYGFTLRGIPCGNCRAPFRPLSEQDKQKVREVMEFNI